MQVIALVGVSGVGKTTLMNKLEERLGSENVRPIPEATKGDICKFSNLPIIDHKLATKSQLYQYDIGRVEYQLKLETEEINICKLNNKGENKYIVFDKALPMSLMYLLTLSARTVPDNYIKDFIREVKAHVHTNYNLLVYIPFNRRENVNKDLNRNFTNKYVLELQDAALHTMMSWFDVSYLKLGYRYDNRVTEITNSLGVCANDRLKENLRKF